MRVQNRLFLMSTHCNPHGEEVEIENADHERADLAMLGDRQFKIRGITFQPAHKFN